MYTLRTFKDKSKIDRLQIYLGDIYGVKNPSEKQKSAGAKLLVTGNHNEETSEGIYIYKDDYAFVMTDSGSTIEVLNRPDKR